MRNRQFVRAAGILLAGMLLSCAVKMPEVQVGGGGSSLDEQVVGSYEQLGSSYPVISSRAAGGTVATNPPSPEVRAAYERQRGRAEDLRNLKRSGAVGEDAHGRVILRDASRLPAGWTVEAAQRVVEAENADRDVIAGWIATSNVRLSLAPRASIDRSLAKMYQRQSPPGTWVEREDGTWVRKE
ncbi:MAG: YdbL family protein [candidate division KSB1 bacterium]|nr:YdbL family protein [candidate division KSB1 bacterium]